MKALVLSGGGALGAYENGAIQWLLGHKEIKYDLLCGISVGALNSAVLSTHELGQEKAAARALNNLWYQISNDKIFKEHVPFKRISTIWKNSIVNSQPLRDLIDAKYAVNQTIEANRKIIVGAVSLTSGRYEEFDQKSPYLKEAVKASSAYPVFFTPIRFNNQWWTDGGVKEIAPLQAAVRAGATEIDLVITAPKDTKRWNNADPTTIEIALRVLDLTYEEILDDDLEHCLSKHPNVKIKTLRPKKELPGSSTNFDPKNILDLTDLGFAEAQALWP